MGQKSGPVKEPADRVVKEIRRATRRQFSAEEKIRIVLSGLRGEDSIAELCRREGIVQNLVWGFFCQARCRVRLPLTSSIRWQHPDDPREPAVGRKSIAPQPCIRLDPTLDPDHEAAIRFGGEAPRGGPILHTASKPGFCSGQPPTRIIVNGLTRQRDRPPN